MLVTSMGESGPPTMDGRKSQAFVSVPSRTSASVRSSSAFCAE